MHESANPRTSDLRSSAELVALALSEPDDEARWNLVATLHFRGGENEFKLATDLARSTEARERCLGADVLGQLGCVDQMLRAESVDLLIPMLCDDDPSVVYSAAYALGHRGDQRAVGPLCALVDHTDADVREGVGFALGGFNDVAAVDSLVRLTSDQDRDVRNWATFSLGLLTDTDTSEVRSALFARTMEDDGEIRGEALVGLARRNDERTPGLVRDELGRDYAGSWVLEAAELVGDSSIVPLLLSLRDRWDAEDEGAFGNELDKALHACKGRPAPDYRGR